MFVVFRNSSEYLKVPFEGYQREDVLTDKEMKSSILRFLMNNHTAIKLNRRINIPLKNIWYPFYLEYEKLDKNDVHYFIFFEGSKVSMQRDYLRLLHKKYPRAKLIFRFVNPVSTINAWILEFVYANYDLIISMEQVDCEKYHWLYVNNTYNTQIQQAEGEAEFDVFFVGSNKGRLECLLQIYRYLTDNGLKCAFFITDVKTSERVYGYKGIHYIKQMKYKKTLDYVKRSRCLLEVVQNGQTGSTLRLCESMVYAKKFITNDKNIVNQEYFDSKNMLCFENIEEIDVKFIEQKTFVDRDKLNKISHDVLFTAIEGYFNQNTR